MPPGMAARRTLSPDVGGTAADRLPRHGDVRHPLRPAHARERLAWHEHVRAGPPVSRVDHEEIHRPAAGLEEQFVDVADLTVGGPDVTTADHPCASQVRIGRVPLAPRLLAQLPG